MRLRPADALHRRSAAQSRPDSSLRNCEKKYILVILGNESLTVSLKRFQRRIKLESDGAERKCSFSADNQFCTCETVQVLQFRSWLFDFRKGTPFAEIIFLICSMNLAELISTFDKEYKALFGLCSWNTFESLSRPVEKSETHGNI